MPQGYLTILLCVYQLQSFKIEIFVMVFSNWSIEARDICICNTFHFTVQGALQSNSEILSMKKKSKQITLMAKLLGLPRGCSQITFHSFSYFLTTHPPWLCFCNGFTDHLPTQSFAVHMVLLTTHPPQLPNLICHNRSK